MRESSQFNNMTNKQKIIWGIACVAVFIISFCVVFFMMMNSQKREYTYSRRNGTISYGDCINQDFYYDQPERWLFKTTYKAEFTTDVDGPWRAEISFSPRLENGTSAGGNFPSITIEGEKGEWVPFVVEGVVDLEGYRSIDYFNYYVTITAL